MGTTSKGLPYPEDVDFVQTGAQDIQGLAEAVDALLGGALFRATVENEPVAGDGTPDVLDINMTAGDSALFTDGGNQITYTGDHAVALMVAQVRWEASGAGARSVELRLNGSEVAKVKDTPDGGAEPHIQNLSWPVILEAGDLLSLAVSQSSGGPLDVLSGKFRCVVLVAAFLTALIQLTRWARGIGRRFRAVARLIEDELHHNGGGSMRDDVYGIAVAVGELSRTVDDLDQRLSAHLTRKDRT